MRSIIAVLGILLFGQATNVQCNRSCLEALANQYVDALVAHDPGRLPLAPNVRYTENGVELNLGDGMWGPSIKLLDYKFYFADPQGGQVGFFGALEEHGHPAILGLRLKTAESKINEIEVIVIRSSARGSFSDVPGMKIRPLLVEPLTPTERRPRVELIAAANAYFDGMEQGTDKVVPFEANCLRIENGVPTANDPKNAVPIRRESCGAQFATGFTKVITAVKNRRFPIVDEERGLVYSIIRFDHNGRNKTIKWNDGSAHPVNTPFDEPFSFLIGELFKIKNGKIYQIEALVLNVPYGMHPGWTQ
jgi:hypothetical protein